MSARGSYERRVSLEGDFCKGTAATGGVLALGGLASTARVFSQSTGLPSPDASGIEHIVVLMMENRSFDHMLGWLDGADGRQRGLRYLDTVAKHIGPIRSHRTSKGAVTRIPIILMRVDASNSTTAHATDGCEPVTTTTMPSAFTQRRMCRSSLRRHRTGPSATATSQRSWPAPSRTGFISTPRRPTGLANTFELSNLPTIWDRLAGAGLEVATTSATSRFWRSGGEVRIDSPALSRLLR